MEKLQNVLRDRKSKTATVNIGVCSGRHEMPVKNFVFDKIDDPTDVKTLEETAWKWYHDTVLPLKEEGYSVDINIYVTGLTVATVAILKILTHCHEPMLADDDNGCQHLLFNGEIFMWYFDAVGKKYYSQSITEWWIEAILRSQVTKVLGALILSPIYE